MIWKIRLVATALLAFALMVPSVPAGARALAPLHECGHHGWIDSENRMGWTYNIRDISGAGMFNVTARNVGCTTARRVSLRALGGSEGYGSWAWNGWRCRFVKQRYEWSKIRCDAARGRTVQWVTAA